MQVGQGNTPSVRLTVFMKPSAFTVKQVECQKRVAFSPQGGLAGWEIQEPSKQHINCVSNQSKDCGKREHHTPQWLSWYLVRGRLMGSVR